MRALCLVAILALGCGTSAPAPPAVPQSDEDCRRASGPGVLSPRLVVAGVCDFTCRVIRYGEEWRTCDSQLPCSTRIDTPEHCGGCRSPGCAPGVRCVLTPEGRDYLWRCDTRDAGVRDAGLMTPDANDGLPLYSPDDYRRAMAGDRNLSGADLRGADLHGANLSGFNLTHANLRGANLRAAILDLAYLADANFYAADLSGAYLNGSQFTDSHIVDAYLYGANLTGVHCNGATRWPAAFAPPPCLP